MGSCKKPRLLHSQPLCVEVPPEDTSLEKGVLGDRAGGTHAMVCGYPAILPAAGSMRTIEGSAPRTPPGEGRSESAD